MLIDKKGRLFGRISIIDIIIIAAAALIIAGAVYLSRPADGGGAASSEGGNLLFTVELSRKEEGYEQYIKVGEKVYDNLKGYYLGEIVAMEIKPYRNLGADMETGVWRETPVDGLYSIYLTIKANAERSDSTTVINNVEVVVGKELFLRSGSFASGGYCIETQFNGGAGA